jgi:hypothetical protein
MTTFSSTIVCTGARALEALERIDGAAVAAARQLRKPVEDLGFGRVVAVVPWPERGRQDRPPEQLRLRFAAVRDQLRYYAAATGALACSQQPAARVSVWVQGPAECSSTHPISSRRSGRRRTCRCTNGPTPVRPSGPAVFSIAISIARCASDQAVGCR